MVLRWSLVPQQAVEGTSCITSATKSPAKQLSKRVQDSCVVLTSCRKSSLIEIVCHAHLPSWSMWSSSGTTSCVHSVTATLKCTQVASHASPTQCWPGRHQQDLENGQMLTGVSHILCWPASYRMRGCLASSRNAGLVVCDGERMSDFANLCMSQICMSSILLGAFNSWWSRRAQPAWS